MKIVTHIVILILGFGVGFGLGKFVTAIWE